MIYLEVRRFRSRSQSIFRTFWRAFLGLIWDDVNVAVSISEDLSIEALIPILRIIFKCVSPLGVLLIVLKD